MRKTIVSLNLGGLSNAKHFTFNKFTATAVTLFAYVSEHFAREIAAFMDALDYENKIYEKVDRTFYNQSITQAEASRTLLVRQFRDIVKALTLEGAADKVAAAERILKVIDLYGGTAIAGKPVDAKSGIILNLVEDMEQKFAAEVGILGIGALVESLKTANDRYIKLRSDRTMLDSEDGKGAMAAARSDTDKFYRIFISAVNNASELGDYAKLADFINYMNTEIDTYRIGLGQGVAGGTSSGSESDDPETVPAKNATFVYANGDSIRRKLEVGTVIIFPDNTAGYVWRPQVKDDIMPNRNIVFREVPVAEAEYIATFHYFDHREEEVKQLAGSVLNAPKNTEGYHWEPEVPEVMPAEDTNYYELPDENGGGTGSGGGSNEGGDPNEGGGGTGSGGGNNGGTGNNPSTPQPDPDDDDEIPEGDDPWR